MIKSDRGENFGTYGEDYERVRNANRYDCIKQKKKIIGSIF